MQRPVTIKTIANEMGLSVSAVSKALNDYPDMGEETKKAVIEKARELGYSPNSMARNLAKSLSSDAIGMVLRDSTTIYGEMFKLLSRKAERENLNLLVGDSNRSASLEIRHVKNMVQSRVKGIIINPVSNNIDELKRIASFRVPLIFLGGRIISDKENFVASDNRHGTKMAMDYLFDLGHRQIAFISDKVKSTSTQIKCDTYVENMTDRKLGPMVFIDQENDSDLVSAGVRQTRALLASGMEFSAVFASKDLVALGVMKELRERGVRVPEDVSVMGYDGSEVASMPMIELTTIAQPKEEITENLIRIIHSQSEGGYMATPEHYLATPQLIIRKTCRSVR